MNLINWKTGVNSSVLSPDVNELTVSADPVYSGSLFNKWEA